MRVVSTRFRGSKVAEVALLLATGIALSGCAAFSGSDSAGPVEKAKFPVPPGGLAANKSSVAPNWGSYQPAAATWPGNSAPTVYMPATYAPAPPAFQQAEADTSARAGGLPDAWPAPAQLPPAGSMVQALPQLASASLSAPASVRPAALAPVTGIPIAATPAVFRPTTAPSAAPPAFTAFTRTAASTPTSPQVMPLSATVTAARPVFQSAVQPVRAVAQPITPATTFRPQPLSAWIAPPRPAAPVVATPARQQVRQPQVAVANYPLVATYAPTAQYVRAAPYVQSAPYVRAASYVQAAPYVQPVYRVPTGAAYAAPATGQLQQLGQVTIDYSVLQY